MPRKTSKLLPGIMDLDDPWLKGGKSSPLPSCYHSHKPLELGGGILHGGNCAHHDHLPPCDLYVALDSHHEHPAYQPGVELWNAPACVYLPIRNFGVPQDADLFRDAVFMVVKALADGMRVHVGCIGGHGRTGMVIGAVASVLNLSDDPIGWTREVYCHKAIETGSQEGFLVHNFGAKPQTKPARYGGGSKTKVDKSVWDF